MGFFPRYLPNYCAAQCSVGFMTSFFFCLIGSGATWLADPLPTLHSLLAITLSPQFWGQRDLKKTFLFPTPSQKNVESLYRTHSRPLVGSSSTLGKQDWIFSPLISPSQDWLSLSPLRRRHNTSPGWPIQQHHQDHWKMVLRCLPHLSSRSGRHLHQGRQCGHETSHVVHQHCPAPTTTPSFRTLLICSLFDSFHSGLQDSEFHLLPFWLFFLLSTYWIFAPLLPWAQLRLRLLKSLFFSISSTYYLSFYAHIVGLSVSGSVWQRYRRTKEITPCYKIK